MTRFPDRRSPGEEAAFGLRSLHFLCEPIEVAHTRAPHWEKRPGCPARFAWREEWHTIDGTLHEWHDYRRRGKMARNMRPEHAATAERRGSWGVGRDHYIVRTTRGRLFELCYDRAPRGTQDRKGSWHLIQEFSGE